MLFTSCFFDYEFKVYKTRIWSKHKEISPFTFHYTYFMLNGFMDK